MKNRNTIALLKLIRVTELLNLYNCEAAFVQIDSIKVNEGRSNLSYSLTILRLVKMLNRIQEDEPSAASKGKSLPAGRQGFTTAG